MIQADVHIETGVLFHQTYAFRRPLIGQFFTLNFSLDLSPAYSAQLYALLGLIPLHPSPLYVIAGFFQFFSILLLALLNPAMAFITFLYSPYFKPTPRKILFKWSAMKHWLEGDGFDDKKISSHSEFLFENQQIPPLNNRPTSCIKI